MQLTFFLLYLAFYVLTLLSFFIYMVVFFNPFLNFNLSLTKLLQRLRTYTNESYLIYFLFFALSGIPPVIFFLVKFNFLIFFNTYGDIMVLVFLFALFFFNMVFYIYLLRFRILKTTSLGVESKVSRATAPLTSGELFNNRFSSYLKYNLVFTVFFSLFILFFSFFFFPDLFLICFNAVY